MGIRAKQDRTVHVRISYTSRVARERHGQVKGERMSGKTDPKSDAKKKVVVCGDAAIDWVDFPADPESPFDAGEANTHCKNWSLQPGLRRHPLGGGAILMTDITRAFTADKADVFGPALPSAEKDLLDQQRIHSYLRLANYEPKPKDKPPIWRVKATQGFHGPSTLPDKSDVFGLAPEGEPGPADLLIIDDAANGCRANENFGGRLESLWSHGTTVLFKMSRPVYLRHREGKHCDIVCSRCNLWSWIHSKYIDPSAGEGAGRLVVVLSADDLRIEECAISKGLSWERTAVEAATALLCHEMEHYARFFAERNGRKELACHVVIRFGLDGALILPAGCDFNLSGDEATAGGGPTTSPKAPRLVYDCKGIEDGYGNDAARPGEMTGYATAFTAGLARALIVADNTDLSTTIESGVKLGLAAARAVLDCGFIDAAGKNPPHHPLAEIFQKVEKNQSSANFHAVDVPPRHSELHLLAGGWSIVTAKGLQRIEGIASEILVSGAEACRKEGLPIGKFGALTTLDKSEIEGFRNIERLVREYLGNTKKKEPLCLAVFGQPGAGKSFGVKQVIKSILGDVKGLTFNLSEFREVPQLARAFHQVCDNTGHGVIPLVFFDEFDAHFENNPCGWLKYFLAPMNDGEFSDGVDIHPVGRAILVFAGGTFSTYQDLAACCRDTDYIRAKAPDFLSRLRGYINILGVNPVHSTDYTCMLRRATMFHENLVKRAESLGDDSHWFMSQDGNIRINNRVAKAFLKAPLYRNSTRSMVAIMEMSSLSGSKGYTKAALPSETLIEMQVDAKAFCALLERDAMFLPVREDLAKRAHQNYYDTEMSKPEAARSPSAKKWNDLDEATRDSNRRQIDAFLSYLDAIGCSVEFDALVSANDVYAFSPDDVDKMARMEHDRWCLEKRAAGWRILPPGMKADEHARKLKFHKDLVPWKDLGNAEQKKDRDAVSNIPELLAECRLAVVKKK